MTSRSTANRELDLGTTVTSDLAAGAAFVAVLEADLCLTGRHVDDLLVLGRPFFKDQRLAHLAGLVFHAVNSVALAALYATVERRLPGPPWLKGILFANAENVLLYPITVFEDLEPAVRKAQVDRYFTWPASWQSVPRHLAYGVVLGVCCDRLGCRREGPFG
jgi:hypothetical protein